MSEQVPSTLLSSSTMLGRLYGQGPDDECMFDVAFDHYDRPIVRIRVRNRPAPSPFIEMPHGTHLLVQLFEQPDVLWLANAVKLNGETPMIVYAPVEPLESADGRCEMPTLAECTLEQVDEAVHDAMTDRDQ